MLSCLMNEHYPTPRPEREQPAFLKQKQTYAEYVAAFVPYKSSPMEEKLGNFCGKIGACLFFLVVLIVIIASW